uniref:NADH-ubiquinone oxidoreductase chain 4L n=1 Tax=Formicosepsis sp. LX2018-01 TaxID=2697604 RepID=A0A6G6A5X5_9MUSC|nr:NADH dehydrogenase subunit 4L [Formicosepsis sp. LX2018-01]
MMMNIYMIMLSIMFLMGVISFVLNRKHLLLMLLILEYMVLTMFLIMFYFLNMMNYENFFSMIFLTFSVCEGALGLSILVSLIRTHGNDYFQSFNVL